MKHNYAVEGYAFRLCPIEVSDAQTIIDIRLEDPKRNQYIRKIDSNVAVQQKWIESYLAQPNSYYWRIENKFTGATEALYRISDIVDNVAVLDSLVVRKNSLAISETFALVFSIAFDSLKADKITSEADCRNKRVIGTNRRIGWSFDARTKIEIDGEMLDFWLISISREQYYQIVKPKLDQLSRFVARHYERDFAR
jgi:RimJ/RimL family protein N-acetyltransferase